LKLSKAVQWALTIGIIVVLLVVAGVIYSRQRTEQILLAFELAQAEQDFTKYSEQKDDLEVRLRQAKSRFASVQDEFHRPTESIEIEEILFQAADEVDVVITKLGSSTPGGEKLKGVSYRVFSLSLTVEGEGVSELLDFCNEISVSFPAAAIQSATIKVPDAGGSGEKATINLRLKVYAYEAM